MTTPRNPAWQTEVDRLQRENGSLARAYAACERLLRDSTEENARLKELYGAAMDGLNKVDAENERLRALVYVHITEHACLVCGSEAEEIGRAKTPAHSCEVDTPDAENTQSVDPVW